jgi:DNA-binding HxlR family transcriptional regulator
LDGTRTAHLRLAIEVISDKWRIGVLHRLLHGPLRTSQLQKDLEEISPKVLTQTLRGLERDGLIHRSVYASVPPRVEYALTETAKYLLAALDSLYNWSESFGRETLLARRRYDTKPRVSPARTQQTRSATKSSAEGKQKAGSDSRVYSPIVRTTRNRALPDIMRS